MTEPDFRKAAWGMSKDEIRASESSPPAHESDNALGYRDRLLGSDCIVYYEFDDEGLARAAYMIDNPDDERDIKDYERLKTVLTKKYGEPEGDGMVFTANVYRLPKISPTIDLQTALSEDAVRLKTWWQKDDTSIALACRGVKGDVQIGVIYNRAESPSPAARPSDTRDFEIL